MEQRLRFHLRVKMGKHDVKFIQTKQTIHVFLQIDGDYFYQKQNPEKQNENENKRDKRSFVEFLLHVVAHDVSHVSIPKIKSS